jgi:hypothetical protein
MRTIAILLLAAGPAWAQVNIEHYRGKMGMTGSASYSFNSDLGNVDVLNSGGAGNVTINRSHGTVFAIFKGGIGVQGGKRFANNGVVHLRYTYKKDRRYQPEGFVQSDYATSRQLDWRTLVGAGLRYNASESETGALSFGTGLMWEREGLDLAPGDPHPDETSLARSSTYVNVHLSGKVLFSTTSYVQVALPDPGDVRLLGIVQLTTPLLGRLNQTTSVDFRVDSEPPGGVEKTDVKISTSFGLKF